MESVLEWVVLLLWNPPVPLARLIVDPCVSMCSALRACATRSPLDSGSMCSALRACATRSLRSDAVGNLVLPSVVHAATNHACRGKDGRPPIFFFSERGV